MTMFKANSRGRGHEVTISCRRCGVEEVTISVIELSRLHHPPMCGKCEGEESAAEEGEVEESRHGEYPGIS